MKLCIITPLFCLLATLCLGQTVIKDSVSLTRSSHKLDSIQNSFYQQTDSLKRSYGQRLSKVDSSQKLWQRKLDSLTSLSFSAKMMSRNPGDSIQTKWKSKIDSLPSLAESSHAITRKLDSLNHKRDSLLAGLDQTLERLKGSTVGKLNNLDLPPQLSGKMSDVANKVNDFKIPADNFNMPSPGLQSDISTLGKGNLQMPVADINVPATGELGNVNTSVRSLPDVTNQVSTYTQDLQQLSKGNLDEVKDLPAAAESKAKDLSGFNEVKDQTKVLDEYKDMAGNMQTPDSMKAVAIQEVRQVAVNHFAGKEQQLKEAMETLAKYKSKYSSLNSIADATKRPPNEMKGKPFIERLVPGIGMQIQKKAGDLLVDFNPYVGYRFTGKITVGLGWNQRFAYNFDNNQFNGQARIFGPRVYGEYKLWKGFSPRVELENMNTSVPPITRTPTVDPFKREWVWGAFVGVKKEYRFIKSVKGTALVMMRMFNPDHKSPYADVVNVRFGFEFPMKKKPK